MKFLKDLQKRRSYYHINRNIPASKEEIISVILKITEATPDAFDMKSARAVIVLGSGQDVLWNAVYDAFGGKLAREKTNSFKNGFGTVLYFIDEDVISALQRQYPGCDFPKWANQANGMLQSNIWTALRQLGVGASLQHYNPVIDSTVKKMFDLPDRWTLIAQMPFGGIDEEPEPKQSEDISRRVLIKR